MNKRRILIVDDEVSFTRLLKLNLEQTEDYEVRIETGADRAVRTAREFSPDLILLDVIMPGIFGDEVACQFAADVRLRQVPVVFLSAAPGGGPSELHGRPFIAKPASVDEIIEGIERHLPGSSSGDPVWNSPPPNL
jgi:CheY-like chemotaxis protein